MRSSWYVLEFAPLFIKLRYTVDCCGYYSLRIILYGESNSHSFLSKKIVIQLKGTEVQWWQLGFLGVLLGVGAPSRFSSCSPSDPKPLIVLILLALSWNSPRVWSWGNLPDLMLDLANLPDSNVQRVALGLDPGWGKGDMIQLLPYQNLATPAPDNHHWFDTQKRDFF